MIQRLPRPFPELPADRPCRILAVDDHPVNRTLLVRLLRRGGFDVCQAVNGADALTLWQQWQPQLILMDLLMPGMDGREATRIIRKQEAQTCQSSTVIIALTADAMPTFSQQAFASGFDSVITKPVQPDILFELIARYLNLQYTCRLEAHPSQPQR